MKKIWKTMLESENWKSSIWKTIKLKKWKINKLIPESMNWWAAKQHLKASSRLSALVPSLESRRVGFWSIIDLGIEVIEFWRKKLGGLKLIVRGGREGSNINTVLLSVSILLESRRVDLIERIEIDRVAGRASGVFCFVFWSN